MTIWIFIENGAQLNATHYQQNKKIRPDTATLEIEADCDCSA